MLNRFSQKNLLSSSLFVLSLFLLSPETKAMKEDLFEEKFLPKKRLTAVPLKFKKLYAQQYTEKDGMITITTDNNNRATYQAETNRVKVTPGETFQIPYNIKVEDGGKVAFGVLNSARNGWIGGEVPFLEHKSYTGVKEIMIPQGESEISLVLLNYHLGTAGQSTFTAKLGLEKVEIQKSILNSVEENFEFGKNLFSKQKKVDYFPFYYFPFIDMEESQINISEWSFEKIAEKGLSLSLRGLGCLYRDGDGVERNIKKAKKRFKKAAEKGDAYSMRYLGCLYRDGDGVEKDIKKAIEYFERAAEKDDAYSMRYLGCFYRDGDGVEKDIKKAIEYFERAAEKGDAYSMHYLGCLYRDGDGVDSDYKQAVKYFELAAEKGNDEAMDALENMYLLRVTSRNEEKYGEWVDFNKVIGCFEKVAEKGYAYIMYRLGCMYKDGNGVEKDIKKAIEWFKKGAEKGDARCETALKKALSHSK
jgi:TPR repeat protein